MAVKVEYKGYTLEFPDSATDADINSYIEQNHSQFEQITSEPKKEAEPVKNTDPNNETNAIERVGWNALKNTVNVLPAIGDTIQLWAAGGDESKVKPFNRMELDEKYTPQGGVEEFAAEAIPYLIPYSGAAKVGAGVAKVAGTGLAGRAASSVAKNAYQGVVGSAANNSDEALGTEFLTDVAVDGVGGALLGKGISMAGNVVKAGKEARRARMGLTAIDETRANVDIDGISSEIHNLSRGHNELEKGLTVGKDANGEAIREAPRTFGELQTLLRSDDPRFNSGGDASYMPRQFSEYLSNVTGGKYNLFSDDIPEGLLKSYPTPETTKIAQESLLKRARESYDVAEKSRFNAVLNNNEAILENSNPLSRAIHKPYADIGALTSEQRKGLGLSRMESLISSIGSKANASLPLDVGTMLRSGSNKILRDRQESFRNVAGEEINNLNSLRDEFINKKINNGSLKSGAGNHFKAQADAWELAKSGKSVDKLNDAELENMLISSNQARINASRGSSIPDMQRADASSPDAVLRNIREIDEFRETKPLGAGSIGSAALGYITGGATTAAQVSAALAGRYIDGAVARDIRRVYGEKLLGDSTRNAVGRGLDTVAEKGSVPIVGGSVDIDMENDKKIQQLDDWASKNGIPEDIMAEAVSRTGADLGSLKGVNRVKAMALEIYDSGRIDNPERVDSEGFNPAFVDNVSKIESAMKEAMYGLSDAEIEELVDEYLDENHLEEDEKLTGLKLQRAQQKAIKWALEKTSS